MRSARAFGVSLLIHGAFFALAIYITMHPQVASSVNPSHDTLNKEIVWLDMEGPGGGGGGGGNKSPEPPRIAKREGKDNITVPVAPQPSLETPTEQKPEENPVQNLTIPAETLSAANEVLPGAVMEGIPTSNSRGSGAGPGAGTGKGPGSGPGAGSGLGDGIGGNTGGEIYQPGNGIENPIPVFQPKPQYTSQAMRAKIQGTVLLECIVLPDGSVGRVEVRRSLDQAFGLDLEAIKAARSWRFRPGMRRNSPVAVLVTIEMAFTLR
jgi:periplasmic protein TonB